MAAVSSSLNLAPVFYGTYKLKPEECREAILTAVRLGYRNFDTAALYKNEADIGDALQESGVARSDLTIIGKLWCNDYHDPRGSCLKSLQALKCQYFDVYLVHYPFAVTGAEDYPNGDIALDHTVSLREVWAKCEALVDEGLIRHIGISNFPCLMVNDLLAYARIKPAVNQLELHPYNVMEQTIAFHRAQGVSVMSFGALGGVQYQHIRPDLVALLDHETVREVAQGLNCTPAQALIAYQISRGVPVVVKARSEANMRANLEAANIQMPPDAVATLSELDLKLHYYSVGFYKQIGLDPFSQ